MQHKEPAVKISRVSDYEAATENGSGKRLYDLHIHSDCSDGRLSVEAVVELAANIGLSGISLTDHDTVSGLAMAGERAKEHGLVFVPGIELNTDYAAAEVHILGYFIDYRHSELVEKLQDLKLKRQKRARQIVERLNWLGFPVSFERVRELAGDELIGRPHVARAMVEIGVINHETEAFDNYIGRGMPAFVPRYNFSPEEAISLISSSGGLPFLAHPGKIHDKSVINTVIDMGICGLEVYYPEHSENEMQYFLGLAAQKGLLASGGSDFHGPGSGRNRERLGLSSLNQHGFDRILEYLKGKKG